MQWASSEALSVLVFLLPGFVVAYPATIKMRTRIASPETLPWLGVLPHLNCSPGTSAGDRSMRKVSMTARPLPVPQHPPTVIFALDRLTSTPTQCPSSD